MSLTEIANKSAVDAFTAEVIRNSVVAITNEMKTNLMRTAYNMIIYEAEDFTVGLFDADGNTISIGLGLPMFIRGLSDAIKAKIAFWGKENIEPGDILLTNDPQVMGSHLNHMIFTLPVFYDGELIAFASSMGHWQDVGGVLGAVTRDIFSEGLQMPFVKIFKRGEQDMEITSIIRTNCRLPALAMGDFRAQIASIRTGERRLTQLLERYGAGPFRESVKLIFDQSERLARAAVRATLRALTMKHFSSARSTFCSTSSAFSRITSEISEMISALARSSIRFSLNDRLFDLLRKVRLLSTSAMS